MFTTARNLIFYFSLIFLCNHASAHSICHTEIKSKLPTDGVILFGEIHGTVELPYLFLECIKEFKLRNEKVQVFLEFPEAMNNPLEDYLQGTMTRDDFMSLSHWRKDDGRGSNSMFEILEKFRNAGIQKVKIFAIDPNTYSTDREEEMNRNFMKNFSSEKYNFVLVGNSHAKVFSTHRFNKGRPSFAKLITDEIKNVIVLQAVYPVGTAWVCTPECGSTVIEGNEERYQKFPIDAISITSMDKGYSGIYRVGSLTSSPPLIYHPKQVNK